MSAQHITLDIVCTACGGTGLYVGMGERNGAAVVCTRCQGTGKQAYSYEPFTERQPAPASVTTVHVGRGYLIGNEPQEGGLPIEQWQPGAVVPADESSYCPFLYTNQEWCSNPDLPPQTDGRDPPRMPNGQISSCKHWANKAECWALFRANAPESVKRQIS